MEFSEDGEGGSNPSPGKQFSLAQIPSGGGDQATLPVRRCRCKACRHLECRSFKNQNDGPLRFGRLFPGWNLSNVCCWNLGDAAFAGGVDLGYFG